jgi:hypothetical protein
MTVIHDPEALSWLAQEAAVDARVRQLRTWLWEEGVINDFGTLTTSTVNATELAVLRELRMIGGEYV